MASDRPDRNKGDLAATDQPGGDGLPSGATQPVSQDEIDNLLNNPDLSADDRRIMLEELSRRRNTREHTVRDSPSMEKGVVAVDEQVGGDDDQPGLAQPVSQDEVDDLLNDPDIPIEDRRMRLEDLAQRLNARAHIDRGNEFAPLEAQIQDALAMLAEGGHTYGTMEAAGLDSSVRRDARAPDEDENS